MYRHGKRYTLVPPNDYVQSMTDLYMSEWVEVSSAYDKDGAKDGTVDRVMDPRAQFVRKYLQAL